MDSRLHGAWIILVGGLFVLGGLLVLFRPSAGSGPAVVQAQGATRYVATSGADAGDCSNQGSPCATVQFAVDRASAGDEILVATGVYTDVQARAGTTQAVYITKTLTIRGGYTTPDWAASNPISNPTTLDAQSQGRVIYVAGASITPTIEGLRIVGGRVASRGGGIYLDQSPAILRNNVVEGNTALWGGGISLSSSAATLVANTIQSNTAYLDGYATAQGGGLYVLSSPATVLSNTIAANSAQDRSGGIHIQGGSPVVSSNAILSNIAGYDGGGVLMGYSSKATLNRNTIEGNRAGTNGGGVYAQNADPSLYGNAIRSNTAVAGGGGGVFLLEFTEYGGPQFVRATVVSNTIENNTAVIGGGLQADDVANGFITITNNLVRFNTATDSRGYYGGGGMNLDVPRNALVAGNVIAGNAAPSGTGGGVQMAGAFALRSNVVTDNRAGAGSGLAISGSPNLLHTTIARNREGDGAGVLVTSGYPVFINTLIYSQTAGVNVTGSWGPAAVTMTQTLWDQNTTDTVGAVSETGHLTGAASFEADGYHLAAGSAAIDRGIHQDVGAGADWDVDGGPRPAGYGFDLGADERAGTAFQMTKRASFPVQGVGDLVTYTASISVAGMSAANLVITDSLPGPQRVVAAAANLGSAEIDPAYGGSAVWRLGTVPAGTGLYLTVTAQLTTTPPTDHLTTTNTLRASADGAGYQAYVSTLFQSCMARVNDLPAIYSSVQPAVDAAQTGDLVKVAGSCFGLRPGGNEQIYVGKTITVRGGYSKDNWTTSASVANPTTLDAQGRGRVMHVYGATISPTVEGLRFTGGVANGPYWNTSRGGGLYVYESNATVRNNVFEGNFATSGGAGLGLFGIGAGDRSISDNSFTGNSGSAIYLQANNTAVRANTILSNTGAGISMDENIYWQGTNSAISNTIRNNGEGVYLYRTRVTIENNDISDNYGNGVRASESAPTIRGNTIHANRGSGIRLNYGSNITIDGNSIMYNRTDSGGGITTYWAQGTIANNAILSNTATNGNGGGVLTDGPSQGSNSRSVLNNNLIQYNVVENGGTGGGVYGNPKAMNGNVIRYNTIRGDYRSEWEGVGSGAYLMGDTDFSNNVVADNRSVGSGSGLWLQNGNYTLVHNTLARNAGGDGSGLYLNYGSLALMNNIVFSQAIGLKNANGTVNLANNLWQANTADTAGPVGAETGRRTGDPAFAADGYHLTAGSAAIDQATYSDLSTDIDGQPREMGPAPDIGADEYAYPADFILTKVRQGPGQVNAGAPITYLLTITNAGPWSSVSAQVMDLLGPASAVAASRATVPGGSCAGTGAVISCTVHNVTTDTVQVMTVVVTTTSTFNGVLSNSAILTPTNGADPNPQNNAAGPVTTTVVYVPPTPDVRVSKSGPSFVEPGQTITYTLSWSNGGGVAAANSLLTDTLPSGLTFITATGSPTVSGQVLNWRPGNLASGASGAYQVTARVGNDLPDGTVLTNTARIATTTPGDPTANNTAVFTSTVYRQAAAMEVSKAAGVSVAMIDDSIRYTIIIRNTGAVPIQPSLVDRVPTGAVYVPDSVSSSRGWAIYSPSNNWVEWDDPFAALDPGQSATIQFSLQVKSCDGNASGWLRNTAALEDPVYAYLDRRVSAETRLFCPDLQVAMDAPAAVQFVPAEEQRRYEILVFYTNAPRPDPRGDHSLASEEVQLRVKMLSDKAAFSLLPGDTTPPASQQVSPRELVWNLGLLGIGDGGQVVLTADFDQFDPQGYAVEATISGQPPEECAACTADNLALAATFPFAVDFQKQALPAKIVTRRPAGSSTPEMFLEQEYLLRYGYQNASPLRPDLSWRQIRDLWPVELDYEAQTGQPSTSFQRLGSDELRWSSDDDFHVGDRGWVRVRGQGDITLLEPYSAITNSAYLTVTLENDALRDYGEFQSVSTIVPLLPPFITEPAVGGEMCPDTVVFRGLAQPGTRVSLYAGENSLAGPVQPNGRGEFELSANPGVLWSGTITARASIQTADGQWQTSGPSNGVFLDVKQLAWCPLHSKGTTTVFGQFQPISFRGSNGLLSTSGWQVAASRGSQVFLSLYGCDCAEPGATRLLTVTVGGRDYATTGRRGKFFDFEVPAGRIGVKTSCSGGDEPPEEVGSGTVQLIDPDGFVFDVTKGLQVISTTVEGTPIYTNTLPGITVTAMVSMPQWGGWIPWPAHMYENQINPQVTGPNGYFAFFTPPGFYYLQVEGKQGYQSWRSPVVHVITEIVHVNVPLTPLSSGNLYTVTLTPEGLSPGTITVPVGSTVAWVSALTATASLTDVVTLSENPVLRPLSALSPLTSTLGFDGGFLEPGQVYRRQFTSEGSYAYTDGLGRNGVVVVQQRRIYVPLVMKAYGP